MSSKAIRSALLVFAATPFIVGYVQEPTAQSGPKCEDIYKDIVSFKGVPASELIPMMEFMSAALGYQCTDCHEAGDYAAPHSGKDVTREMITLQKDINARYFNNRVEVTCVTCHRGSEHPVNLAISSDTVLRHARMANPPKPEELLAQMATAMGTLDKPLVRKGTLTAPNDETHKEETLPVEFTISPDGKFKIASGSRVIVSNGKSTWYGGFPLEGEPAAVFARIGRAWVGTAWKDGLTDLFVMGTDKVDNIPTTVVRAKREATSSTEELYLDAATSKLLRMTNLRRTPIGSVVTTIDYAKYQSVSSMQVPMAITVKFAGHETWKFEFASAALDPSVTDAAFSK